MTLPVALTPGDIVSKDRTGRTVQRNKTVPAELGTAYGQHRGVDVDIANLEIARLADPHSGDASRPNRQW